MFVLLLQLSDIHIMVPDDPVLGHADLIASAIKDISPNIERVLIILSGDIAQSGLESEYLHSVAFLDQVKDAILESMPGRPSISFVMVPGNHDCDFSQPDMLRSHILDSIAKGALDRVDTSIITPCTSVQNNFFEFKRIYDDASLKIDGRLYFEYRIKCGTREIALQCYNTAWVSQRREVPGALRFPSDSIPDVIGGADIAISIFHHPYAWLHPDNARIFRHRIEETSDIVLTGHEHSGSQRVQASSTGEINEYIEGQALQERGSPHLSGFNVIVIDTSEKAQRFFAFALDGGRYIRSYETSEWEPLQISKLRSRKQFEIHPNFLKALEDPGVPLARPGRDSLKLSDIYVYPDIQKFTLLSKSASKVPNALDVVDSQTSGGKLLLLGDDRSGKTCLAKQTFLQLRSKGYVPLLADGNRLVVNFGPEFIRECEKLFRHQYDSTELEAWRQLPKSQRVIIIDDFHALNIKKGRQVELIARLEGYFGRIILIADEVAQQVLDLVSAITENGDGIQQYKILPFGYKKRNEIVEKWFLLDSTLAEDDIKLSRRIEDTERILNTVTSNSFVPSYPIFIISILKAETEMRPVDTTASTYGYYYELFIRSSVANMTGSMSLFDTAISYLAHLAYKVYHSGRQEFTSEFLRGCHEEFLDASGLEIELSSIKKDLVKHDLLDVDGDTHRFKYPFLYYYFVASYMRDHINEAIIRDDISRTCQNLQDEESANILLFLVHLSKDPFIISQVVEKATEIFNEFTPARLENELLSLATSDEDLHHHYVERDVRESRQIHLDQLDRIANIDREREVSKANIRDEFTETDNYLSRFGAAFKTVQILGQILKNFPGSIHASDKLRIARECYQTGMRALESWFDLLESQKTEAFESLTRALKEDCPTLSPAELDSLARRTVFSMGQMIGYATVRRIASAIGMPDLFKIYKQLRDAEDTPAAQLVYAALQLDHGDDFPQLDMVALSDQLDQKKLALSVLRTLVVNHFYMRHVDFRVKQSTCQKLGILYESATNPKMKLLPERN